MSVPSTRDLRIRLAFGLGAEVQLRTRPEPLAGLVVALMVRPGLVTYCVAWGDATESTHYDFELELTEDSPCD